LHLKEPCCPREAVALHTGCTLFRRAALEEVGVEYQVLTGPLLDLSKVENIIVEVHYRYGSRESWEIMQALARRGFKIVPLYSEPNFNRFHLLACRSEITW
jgi:hypothetical protein